ncbi:MAG: exodeoxyribonuclease VII small subunit [Lachnospiraceae bacterium]|nr:exodeoxyribonuclease VII small subunit [Lachnospiraceae bacterium]
MEQGTENRTLEEMLGEVESLVRELESSDISLEDSFTKYKKGIELIAECNATIDKVEKAVALLGEDGSLTALDPE